MKKRQLITFRIKSFQDGKDAYFETIVPHPEGLNSLSRPTFQGQTVKTGIYVFIRERRFFPRQYLVPNEGESLGDFEERFFDELRRDLRNFRTEKALLKIQTLLAGQKKPKKGRPVSIRDYLPLRIRFVAGFPEWVLDYNINQLVVRAPNEEAYIAKPAKEKKLSTKDIFIGEEQDPFIVKNERLRGVAGIKEREIRLKMRDLISRKKQLQALLEEIGELEAEVMAG